MSSASSKIFLAAASEVGELGVQIGDDFGAGSLIEITLPTHCKFLALMPQWDFLEFLAGHGRAYPAFILMMQSEVIDLLEMEAHRRSASEHAWRAVEISRRSRGRRRCRHSIGS